MKFSARPVNTHLAAGAIDRGARGFNSRHCRIEIIKRHAAVVRRILDRQSGDAGRDAARHVLRQAVEIVGKPVLEIGIERHVGRVRELAEMRQHLIAAQGAVGKTLRMGVARTRRRQRFESRGPADSARCRHSTDWE